MDDTGATKDDVKLPEGEVGEKINRLFREEEKDTSMFSYSRFWIYNLLTGPRRRCPDLHG